VHPEKPHPRPEPCFTFGDSGVRGMSKRKETLVEYKKSSPEIQEEQKGVFNNLVKNVNDERLKEFYIALKIATNFMGPLKEIFFVHYTVNIAGHILIEGVDKIDEIINERLCFLRETSELCDKIIKMEFYEKAEVLIESSWCIAEDIVAYQHQAKQDQEHNQIMFDLRNDLERLEKAKKLLHKSRQDDVKKMIIERIDHLKDTIKYLHRFHHRKIYPFPTVPRLREFGVDFSPSKTRPKNIHFNLLIESLFKAIKKTNDTLSNEKICSFIIRLLENIDLVEQDGANEESLLKKISTKRGLGIAQLNLTERDVLEEAQNILGIKTLGQLNKIFEEDFKTIIDMETEREKTDIRLLYIEEGLEPPCSLDVLDTIVGFLFQRLVNSNIVECDLFTGHISV